MKRALVVAAMLAVGGAIQAQPAWHNADVQERAAGDLPRTVRQLTAEAGPLWIGYAVAAADRGWNACCHDGSAVDGCGGGCRLEPAGSRDSLSVGSRPARPIPLEREAAVVVMLRVLEGRVERIRVFSELCALDAGDRRVYWLTGVTPAQSVALLAGFAERSTEEPSRGRRLADSALMALSVHREPSVADALTRLARQHPAPQLRGKALFWLAQVASRKTAAAITDAIENDPDTHVKTRAVFALSQLPRDEGVPKLIEVARTNRNAKVRRQAMFWLGESRDPRALKFFEEVLSRD
jgi:hypothetical protein